MTGNDLLLTLTLRLYHLGPTLLALAPGVALAVWARSRLWSVPDGPRTELTGARAALRALEMAGAADGVSVVPVSGPLATYYDPRRKELRLAGPVYRGQTASRVALALHEVGHAIQDAQGYRPLTLRWPLVFASGIGSRAAWLIVLAGVAMDLPGLAFRGALLGLASVGAAVALLPIERDANARARRSLSDADLDELAAHPAFAAALSAAAWDYVAATLPFSPLPASTALLRSCDPGPGTLASDPQSPASP